MGDLVHHGPPQNQNFPLALLSSKTPTSQFLHQRGPNVSPACHLCNSPKKTSVISFLSAQMSSHSETNYSEGETAARP
ncbi:hypothetical protein H5410_024702 [Solanum commersonii]|uniref:Uncharacterized protein n=1 Tax=Solanum commersonii TaxID=4109 RepID=A0A9J5ZMN5_SOLCO|nr:hypothetical protein H5410_024702 [Solanum commersonii]